MFSPDAQLRTKECFRKIIVEAYTETLQRERTPKKGSKPEKGRVAKTKALNLLIRLDKRTDDMLIFIIDKFIPFSNNVFEQDIMLVKLHLKIFGYYRSLNTGLAFPTFVDM
jgi:transposase